MPILSFAEAVHNATKYMMMYDARIHVLGLGATYPNGLDGTMGNLAEKYPNRVHDTPCSENAVTGMAVGMAVSGLKPLVHHGRIEFALHAMDQIITQSAKWNYMFGGNYQCPLTLRIAMGRQWGNGPQHTLTPKGLFAVPGLRVVCPSTPSSARLLLIAALDDINPVIYLESRWLYKIKETVTGGEDALLQDTQSIYEPKILKQGTDITIVAVADMVLEALRAAELLKAVHINAEVIDIVSVYPLDMRAVLNSMRKTGHLICVDASTPAYSIAHEIIARTGGFGTAITCPDIACPTAPSLTADYYPTAETIATCAVKKLDKNFVFPDIKSFSELNLPPTENIDGLLGKGIV